MPERRPAAPEPSPPSIEVARGATSPIAVVSLRGGHDIATSRELRSVLADLAGDVLLDLSQCEFIDSSVIFVIFADSNRRVEQGSALELLVPPGNVAVRRTLELARAREILHVRESAEPDPRGGGQTRGHTG